MKYIRHLLISLIIVGWAMNPFVSAHALDWNAAGVGVGNAMQKYGEMMRQEALENERFERQKRLMEQQMELEKERREEALRLEREENARRQELARKKAEEERRLAISTGTGFFVAPNGYLVTNNHVIDDTTDYAVRDFKGRFYRTQLVARDPKRDLALLRVAGNFPSLRIAHSDTVSKGQRVFAVGYPQIAIQGNESKVTDGIVSSFSGIRNDDDWFQISVPIQGGNSGGPLVTESGIVVGVVVASVNISKYYAKAGTLPQNVNYAIKSKLVLDFLKDQGVKNTPSVPAKAGLETVDSATAMVIAKNGTIDVAYTVSPDQAAADERTRQKLAAEDAKKRKADELAEKKKQAQLAVDEAKRKKEELIAEKKRQAEELAVGKRRQAEELASEKKRQAEEKIALKRQHDEALAVELRDLAVQKVFPDWQEVARSDMFRAWIREQTDSASEKITSKNPADVIDVIRRYQAVREDFAASQLKRRQDEEAWAAQREEAEHWNRAESASDNAIVQSYLDRYPKGRYVLEALEKLAALNRNMVNVGLFATSTPDESEMKCRVFLRVKTPGKIAFVEVVRIGFLDALKNANVYSANSSVLLSGHLDAIDFDSTGGFWDLVLTIKSTNGKSLTISDRFEYATSFVGTEACRLTSEAFRPAVKSLVSKALNSPEFSSLLAKQPAAGNGSSDVRKEDHSQFDPGKTFKDCADCPEMVIIPAGSFDMGGSESNQQPIHRVTLKAFAIGKTEVTQGQWKAVMGSNPSFLINCGDNCPVDRVSWDDATEFIRKLNDKTGKIYRLPSEAEWEYACRAGGRQEYCGSDNIDSVAWYLSNSGRTTHPAAGKQANAFGLYDMSGNVWEWVEDCANANYNGAPTDGSEWSSGQCSLGRVLRGGALRDIPRSLRAAYRNWRGSTANGYTFGFRLARMLP